MRSKPQSMPRDRTVASISSRFAWPSRTSAGISASNLAIPLAIPCVRLAEQKPPLRPDAAQPTRRASSSTISADGSRSTAISAVHRPVNPPPITASRAPVPPVSRGVAGGASARSSQ